MYFGWKCLLPLFLDPPPLLPLDFPSCIKPKTNHLISVSWWLSEYLCFFFCLWWWCRRWLDSWGGGCGGCGSGCGNSSGSDSSIGVYWDIGIDMPKKYESAFLAPFACSFSVFLRLNWWYLLHDSLKFFWQVWETWSFIMFSILCLLIFVLVVVGVILVLLWGRGGGDSESCCGSKYYCCGW